MRRSRVSGFGKRERKSEVAMLHEPNTLLLLAGGLIWFRV